MRFSKNQKRKEIVRILEKVFPQQPEARLMCGIVCQAIKDFEQNPEDKKVRQYLSGSITHAEMCNINSKYIRLLIKKGGLGDLTN